MRSHLAKRSCDQCISRKLKCVQETRAWPCDTCQKTAKQQCTYLKPAKRRGPKVRRFTAVDCHDPERRGDVREVDHSSDREDDGPEQEAELSLPDTWRGSAIPPTILAPVVRLYQQYSYSVWPVINAEVLLHRLENSQYDQNMYCLATALCAATMAQLNLAPMLGGNWTVDSTVMAMECIRMREQSQYRENLDVRFILASFFLHVFHAKVNQRNSAMMFIQEAISGARLLGLDFEDRVREAFDVVENGEILFPLLWVSERGYAMHLGLTPSYTDAVQLPYRADSDNVHVQGLLELVRLFAAFDKISLRHRTGRGVYVSAEDLAETEATLSTLCLGQESSASTRMADYCITREWMRTIIWQKALSMRLLSSMSITKLMTFDFPAVVSRDLLHSLRRFSESDLLPLGRDQLLKCFEVANSLADTVLLTPIALHPRFQLRPQDFLHALYQKLLPFLEEDPMLKSILRAKTAEALVKAPARLLDIGIDHTDPIEDEFEWEIT